MLSDHLPQEYKGQKRQGNVLMIDLEEGTTISQVVEHFQLPAKWVHLVLVDGAYVQPEDRATQALQDGQALAIWPPVAGG